MSDGVKLRRAFGACENVVMFLEQAQEAHDVDASGLIANVRQLQADIDELYGRTAEPRQVATGGQWQKVMRPNGREGREYIGGAVVEVPQSNFPDHEQPWYEEEGE